MKDSFTIHQDLTLREYIIVIFYSIASSRPIKTFLFIVLGLSILNAVFRMMTTGSTGIVSFINNMGPVIGIFILMNGMILSLCFIVYKSRPYLFRNVSYDFTNWGMVRHGEKTEFSQPWRNVTKVKETKAFFLFNIGVKDFHCIQKKMFTNEDEINSFRVFLKEKMTR